MPDTNEIDDFLPLTPAAFHILLVLADGAAHGYAIMQEVERLTNGRVHLGPGTLYRSIQRLLDDGLTEGVPPAGSASDDERRNTYRLTALGERVARGEAARLAALVRVARQRGLLDPPAAAPRHAARARRGAPS